MDTILTATQLRTSMDPSIEFEQASTIQATQVQATTKSEFWKKRWYTPYHIVTVVNPKAQDFPFLAEGRSFIVKAGSTAQFPGPVANIYVNLMAKIMAQDDNKIEFIADFALLDLYYDKVIVDVQSLIQEAAPTQPAYMQETAAETPPWVQPPAQAPTTVNVDKATVGEDKSVQVGNKEHSFEQGEDKFRSIVNKNGNRMYYKNGQLINEAEYAKAASMI